MKSMDYQLIRFMVDYLQNYFPDTAGVILMLNAPFLFSSFWSLVKRWLDPVSAKKVRFVSQKDLLQYIDGDSLPQEYGGKDLYQYCAPESLPL